MFILPTRTGAIAALVCLVLSPKAAAQAPAGSNELDAFMEKVLARRDVNRQTLKQYVLDETESFELLGPGRDPLYRQKREFTWYVRDGIHVRSPVRFDGVAVGEDERRQYEARWLRRERSRLERARNKDAKDGKAAEPEPQEPDPATGAMPIATPRFVSEAYFMDFKFEPGNYYLAGREQLEGKEVLKIEYYPQRMFSDDDKDDEGKEGARENRDRQREGRREKDIENRIERQMNKTALITLWIDPAEYQIVKYTFDNVWLDFLPGGWLVRVDDIGASMTMGQPFPGVWLPRAINIKAGVSLANGSYDAAYVRTFDDYREADVKSRIRVPKEATRDPNLDQAGRAFQNPLLAGPVAGQPHPSSARKALVTGVGPARRAGRPRPAPPAIRESETHLGGSGPFVVEAGPRTDGQAQTGPEVIGEIRVHGNATLLDADVIALAGIAVGQQLPDAGVAEIERRLKQSGRFESVEVRKRYRSLTATNDVAIVLVVHEHPGVTSTGTAGETTKSGPFSRFAHRLMFLPILSYADGYSFTYGGRVSTLDLLGMGERLSVPLTWGGTRRAALEFERAFDTGPLSRVQSSIGIWNRDNPHFEIREQRVEWNARAERQFASFVRAGAETSRSTVDFGTIDDELWTFGADVTLDTRGDPTFPRNAVLMRGGWTALNIDGRGSRINRWVADARGYVGVIGQLVVAGRVQYTAADARLPDYERLLLGGSPTVRGFEAGQYVGDRTFVTSAEARLPLTSVLNSAKLGVTAFVDAGRAYDFGTRFDDAEWRRGAGAGVFLIAPLVKINLDVAHGLKTGTTRVHLTTGFMF